MFLNKLKLSVEKMGFKYSMIDYFKSLAIYSSLMIIVAYLHQLKWYWILVLVATIVLMLPFIIYAQFKYIYEFNQFNDLCLYLKQMIIQYKTHHKINVALEKTLETFEHSKSQMPSLVCQALTMINSGKSYQESLGLIEAHYHNPYIYKVHSYLILGEHIGGDHVYQALNNVDFESWQNDILSFQKQKNTVRKTNIYFTLLSVAISLFCVLFFPEDLMRNVYNLGSFQLLTCIYFEIMIISHVAVTSGLSKRWEES